MEAAAHREGLFKIWLDLSQYIGQHERGGGGFQEYGKYFANTCTLECGLN